MKITLGFGSNLGDRKNNLESALSRMVEHTQASQIKVSPLYETLALLPPGADSSWNQPFLNFAATLESDISSEALLECIHLVEKDLGRIRTSKWAPREIDIDILFYGDTHYQNNKLTIPHPEITNRAFVMDPLKDLDPYILVPANPHCMIHLARSHTHHSPVWMGVLNVTPDSFSDGGEYENIEALEAAVQNFDKLNIGVIDLGAESTRPNAIPTTPETEWKRLEPSLKVIQNYFGSRRLRSKLSLDSRNPDTIEKALKYGVDIINDVSGAADSKIVEIARDHQTQYVLMHSLSVPADPNLVLPTDIEPIDEIMNWFDVKIDHLISKGLMPKNIILDPGIGFGKTALQSQNILKEIEKLYKFNMRVLVGHSRKSFLKSISTKDAKERDAESVGVSLALASKGVDILRVHNPEVHIRGFQGWNHLK